MLGPLRKARPADTWAANSVGTKKIKVLDRPKSSTKGQSGMVATNSFMELLVELPNGQRTYMTQKEVDKFNNQ